MKSRSSPARLSGSHPAAVVLVGPYPSTKRSQTALPFGICKVVTPSSNSKSKAPPNSSRKRSGLPHSKGDGGGLAGGGGIYGRITWNHSSMVPPGDHVQSPRRPPFRHTRASSRAASSEIGRAHV